MEETPPTRRRLFRFTLGAMFVVMLVCFYLGWAIHWKHQRAEFHKNLSTSYGEYDNGNPAPFPLNLLGESGYDTIYFGGSLELNREAERLFPEAQVNPVYVDWIHTGPQNEIHPPKL